jgi:hypothetical protein
MNTTASKVERLKEIVVDTGVEWRTVLGGLRNISGREEP